jgi:bud emergence protein 1
MMKSLRKSLNGHRETHRLEISTPLPLPSVSKPQNACLPPQKVIRAIASYRPQGPQQLPFQKGDFFYVTGNVESQGDWYDAHNPVTGARGLVPKSMFEEFCKSPALRTSSISVAVNNSSLPSPTSPPRSPKAPAYFAIVLHDFIAERADELDAKSGDCITVVAQSNREWFVAKPIGRLGRPGLIPASFVEVRNPTTNLPVDDVDALIDSGDLPGVEEWKKAMFNYKANSISLGVIEEPSAQHSSTQSQLVSAPPRATSPVLLPEGILLSADVVSFHNEMDEYWFRTDAIYQPYDPHDPQTLPKAKQLVLFRVYNDFFDFQVNLLQAFSREAGREPDSVRILPFMPGPTEDVDDEITAARREELDEYLHKLCALNTVGASYILEHQLVREFLSLKPGDVEHDIDPRYDEVRALFAEEATGDQTVTQEFEEEVRDTLGEMKLSDRDDRSEGSDYGEDHTPPTHIMSRDSQTSTTPQPHRPNTATSHHRTGSRSKQNGHSSPSYPRLDTSRVSASSRSSFASNSAWPEHATPSPSSAVSSQPSIAMSSRSRSLSNATNMNAPPMSAGNSQTAFVKIKIFDRVTDDLIAIRVHPRVTHAELLEKVQARLGGNVLNLRYRHSLSNEFIGIDDDRDLREWLDSTEKHVLYAE